MQQSSTQNIFNQERNRLSSNQVQEKRNEVDEKEQI